MNTMTHSHEHLHAYTDRNYDVSAEHVSVAISLAPRANTSSNMSSYFAEL